MRGRFEVKEIVKIAIFPMAIFFLILLPSVCSGQSLPESVIRILEQQAESGGADLESMVLYCEALMERPLDLNSASEDELSDFPLLSPFQVASIMEYRASFGAILSEGELALIDGFSQGRVEILRPFIFLGGDYSIGMPAGERLTHKVILRSNTKYERGAPWGYYGRYKFSAGERISAGGVVAYNGTSAYLQVGEIKGRGGVRLKNGVVGNYTARMGQGLLLWNSFSLSGGGNPSSVMRRGAGLVPHGSPSRDECFCGFGGTLAFGQHVESTVFFSGDKEYVAGGAVSYRGERYKVGLNLLGINDQGWGGGVSLDGMCSLGRFRLFSEIALDVDGDEALLAGAILPFRGDFECSVGARWYSPDYDAPYAGGLSSISSVRNQGGVLLNWVWHPLSDLQINGVQDIVYYPAPRHGVRIPSLEVESTIEGLWSRGGHEVGLRWRYRYYGHQGRGKNGLRLDYHYRPSSGVYAGVRGEVVWDNIYRGILSPGVALYLECGYLPLRKRWEVALRGTVYHIDSWDNRIYFYERDLPQYFSVPALYRRGWDVYAYIKYAPLNRVGLYLKISTKAVRCQLTLTF
jgi:hypothetical protein